MIEPKTPFEELIIKISMEVAETVILKNRDYKDSYKELREEAEKLFSNERIPLWVYQTVKRNRYIETGKADTCIDGAGYWILEEACRREML